MLRAVRLQHPWLWVGYALSAALGMYTHMTMGFVIAGQFLTCLGVLYFERRKPVSGWLPPLVYGFGLAGLLTVVLHAPVLPQIMNTVGGSEKSVVTEWKSPLWTALEILRGLEVGFASFVAGAGALALFAAGALSYLKTRPVVLALLVLPAAIGAVVVIAIGHHLWPRFFFFALGFAILVVVRGPIAFGEWLQQRFPKTRIPFATAGVALSLALVLASALSVPFAYGPKQDYEGALRFVEDNLQPGDRVVTTGLAANIYRQFYQVDRNEDWLVVDSLLSLDKARAHSGRTWLLYTFPPVLESVQPEIMDSIRRDFNLVQQFPGTVAGGTVFVIRADGATSVAR
jgi:hypothetical protein